MEISSSDHAKKEKKELSCKWKVLGTYGTVSL